MCATFPVVLTPAESYISLLGCEHKEFSGLLSLNNILTGNRKKNVIGRIFFSVASDRSLSWTGLTKQLKHKSGMEFIGAHGLWDFRR